MNTMGFLHSAYDFMIREEPFMDMYGNFVQYSSELFLWVQIDHRNHHPPGCYREPRHRLYHCEEP